MAAYAALVSLMNNVEQMMSHHRLSTSLDKKQIQPLLEKAGFLLDFIEGNNYGGGSSKEAEDLEREIACAAHAAEDVIESHIVDQIEGRTSLGSSLDLQQIIEDMDAVMQKATELKKKRRSREEQPTHSRSLLMETGESGSTAMVGLDDELIQLLDELTGHQSSRNIISIVGMGGMGKTTLAKNVYENLLIKQHFDIRAWATVSEQFDAVEILSQLLSGLGQSSRKTVDSLGEQLHKTLCGRRYLFVLDDLWSVNAWDKVRRFFPDNGNRSRIVLTTRLSNVAKDCGSSSITEMKFLDDDNSWKLFCEKALFPQKDDPPQLEDVGKEIANSCKGLALSIVVIGGLLLKSPRTVGYWTDVAKDIKSIPNSKEKQQSLDVLSLSYSHLPPRLKPCFLYMGVFKEDSEIRVSRIMKLWVAEGFLKPNGAQVLEEIAASYLKDLIDRNLISVIRHRQNGKIGSCGIHDLLRDLCIKVAEEQQFFHVSEGEVRGTERRLVFSNSGYQGVIAHPFARSIMAPDCHIQSVKYTLVRVWDEDFNHSAEDSFGNFNLRYISYKHLSDRQPLWELPSSLSLIWNLQTLIIKRDYICPLIVAPTETWKEMRLLRHVECPQIYLPSIDEQDDLFVWENLQTLKTAVNLRLSEVVCNIIPNIKELYLWYNDRMQGYDHSLFECLCNLDRLHKLESLNLRGGPRPWDPVMNKKLRFPSSLNKLSLISCYLDSDDLRMIGSLPQLQVLKLEYSVFVGERWSLVDGQFLRLKFLKIQSCQLENWNAESSHFPVLEKFLLINSGLKEIPMDFGEIPTLKLIHVAHCQFSAVISAVKIKEDQLEIQDDDGLQIKVDLLELERNRFKEALEAEGLTTNNIHSVLYHFHMRHSFS